MTFWTFQVATPGVKQGPASQAAPQQPVIADKQAGHEPASPRSLQRSRYIGMLLCSVLSFFIWIQCVLYMLQLVDSSLARLLSRFTCCYWDDAAKYLCHIVNVVDSPFLGSPLDFILAEAKWNSELCSVTLVSILQVIPFIMISVWSFCLCSYTICDLLSVSCLKCLAAE